jgi:hypothetical protein
MAIQNAGGSAISLVGPQIGMYTDGTHTNARITGIEHARLRQELVGGRVVVCAGFQGVGPDGNITTLGRGGSDTSAVALAAALKADVCEILTDVDGVYTTDPRVEPRARKIPRITYEEMLELASLGAKVLQIRSVEFAMKYSVPVHVRSSQNDSEGTWIMSEQRNLESAVVTGVALDRNEAKVTLTNVPDVPGTVAAIFGQLARANIVVDMIIQNASRNGTTDVTFTVPENDLRRRSPSCAPRPAGQRADGDPERSRDLQDLDRRRRHADPRGRGRARLRDPRPREHQHPDGLDLGDQGLGRGPRALRRAGACARCTPGSGSTRREMPRLARPRARPLLAWVAGQRVACLGSAGTGVRRSRRCAAGVRRL